MALGYGLELCYIYEQDEILSWTVYASVFYRSTILDCNISNQALYQLLNRCNQAKTHPPIPAGTETFHSGVGLVRFGLH